MERDTQQNHNNSNTNNRYSVAKVQFLIFEHTFIQNSIVQFPDQIGSNLMIDLLKQREHYAMITWIPLGVGSKCSSHKIFLKSFYMVSNWTQPKNYSILSLLRAEKYHKFNRIWTTTVDWKWFESNEMICLLECRHFGFVFWSFILDIFLTEIELWMIESIVLWWNPHRDKIPSIELPLIKWPTQCFRGTIYNRALVLP